MQVKSNNIICTCDCEHVEFTEACDAQQMLCPLSDRGRQRQVHKGLHPEFIDEAQPEVVLLLDRVCWQRV